MSTPIYANTFLSTSTIVFDFARKEIFRRTERYSDEIYWSQMPARRVKPVKSLVFTVNSEPLSDCGV